MISAIKIAVLVSGSGTNLQSLIDNCESGFIPGKIRIVLSSKGDAYALERARKAQIETLVIERKNFSGDEEYSAVILKEVKARDIDLICLAGFLKKLGVNIVRAYRNKIMNIHPALLPEFGGSGMYGLNVHKAVLSSNNKYTGCTVHFVDEKYDHGQIILQEKIAVLENDTPETLAERVLKLEHKLYPEAVRLFALGKIRK